ncbi:MAG TPA: hypothetical protein EYP10_13375, partial [Armatimonadetes bacterium]|nr:hypothetical protein [Armatimonadota bacterium]
ALLDAAEYRREVPEVPIVEYPWELIDRNADLIRAEFPLIAQGEGEGTIDSEAHIFGGDRSQVYIGRGAVVHPTVVLDVSEGPIYIGENTIVFPPTRIEGPSFIGNNCWIVGGKIREGCHIGHTCRVGGEVEESIFHSYSNKYHDGFFGHAYVGEWVNIGALTTNSDLKDTYGPVRITIEGRRIEAGLKVGCYIGDNVKTSIGTLIYTGRRIGFASHLHGVVTEDVPSFTIWVKSLGADGDKVELLLESAITTHRRSIGRRKLEQTPEDRELFETLFELTREERERAGVRQGSPTL